MTHFSYQYSIFSYTDMHERERHERKRAQVKFVNPDGFIEEPAQWYTCEPKDTIWDLKKRIARREHFNPEELQIKYLDDPNDLQNDLAVEPLISNGHFLVKFPESEVRRDRLNVTHEIANLDNLIVFTGPASNYKSFLVPQSQKCSLELHLGDWPLISDFGGKRKIALIDEYDGRRQMYRSLQYFVKDTWTVQVSMEMKGNVRSLKLKKLEKDGKWTELEGVMKNYYVSKGVAKPSVSHETIQGILKNQ